MSPQVIALGELLVEVMRTDVDQPLSQPGEFVGPFPSGAPAIFIDAVARLGASAGFIGVIGGGGDADGSGDASADDFGQCVLSRLRDDGVDTTHVRIAPGYTTGIAFVAYRSDGSRNFLFHLPQAAASLLNPEDVDVNYVAGAEFLHVTGSALSIGESARQACYKAIRACKAAGGRVSFDPNIRPELLGVDRVREICQPLLDQCDLLLPSGLEATMLTGHADQEFVPAVAVEVRDRDERGPEGLVRDRRGVHEMDGPGVPGSTGGHEEHEESQGGMLVASETTGHDRTSGSARFLPPTGRFPRRDLDRSGRIARIPGLIIARMITPVMAQQGRGRVFP